MRPARAQASLTGERSSTDVKQTMKDMIHFSCNIIGGARLS